MACVPLPTQATGGFECEFVHLIPLSLSCPICLLPFRDPHLLDCCGAKYCAECVGRVKASGQPCPICKQQFNTLLDKNDQRKVLSLKVRCSKNKEGCKWEGELRRLNDHEKEQCERSLVKCCYNCGGRIPRCRLAKHEQEECPQRPMDMKMECLMRKMEQRHMADMAAVREEFKREMEKKDKAHNAEMDVLKQSLKKCLAVQEEMKKTFTRAQQNAHVTEKSARTSVEEIKRASVFTVVSPLFSSAPQQNIAENSARTSAEERRRASMFTGVSPLFSSAPQQNIAENSARTSAEERRRASMFTGVSPLFSSAPQQNIAENSARTSAEERRRASMFTGVSPLFSSAPQQNIAENSARTSAEERRRASMFTSVHPIFSSAPHVLKPMTFTSTRSGLYTRPVQVQACIRRGCPNIAAVNSLCQRCAGDDDDEDDDEDDDDDDEDDDDDDEDDEDDDEDDEF